jgi:hypothetical protein
MNRFTRILGLLMLIVLGITFSVAQTSRGTVTGTVTDPSGAVVPKANVTLTDQATKVVRTAETNSAGIYRFDAVNLGTYEVTVDAAGFTKASVLKVEVSAAKISAVDVKLKIGSGADTVTVEAEAVQLQTEEQTRIENISSRKIVDLPVAGQNAYNFILTVPGVVTTDQGGSTNSGIGSVNGARPRSNSFLIDGVENNDISVNGPAFVPTNQDAIQEVAIQTSNFSAEFGRAGGAVVNQVTKSGTNTLHGTAAWLYRTQNFNAASRQERAKNKKSVFLDHTPAFTLGGPVVIPKLYDGHNKTFFFVGGQWDRLNQGSALSSNIRVPTANGAATLQSLAAAGCTQAQAYLNFLNGTVAPTATNTLDISIPTATFGTTGSCNGTARTGMGVELGIVARAVPSIQTDDNHTVRIDHAISDKQQVSARWLYDHFNAPNGGTIAASQFGDADQVGRTMGMALTHTYTISPTMTNELRFNFGRINFQFPLTTPNDPLTLLPTVGFAVTANSPSTFGASATFPQGRVANNWQYQDVVTLVRGKHTFRMGADFLRQIAKQVAPANIRGSITYQPSTGISSFANFLDGFSGNNSSAGPVTLNYGTPAYRPNLFRQAYFFQDSWKAKENLTLNVGLRYENFGQPANFFKYPVVETVANQFDNTEKVKQDNNNFGPTVGFAYTPRIWNGVFGTDKTVIRGGFQVSYDTFFNNLLSNMAGGNPNLVSNVPIAITVNSSNPRGRSNVNGLFTALTPAPLNPLTTASSQFSRDIANPYTMRFSLGVQRELPWHMLMDVSYVGAETRKQFRTAQLNPLLPNEGGANPNTQPKAATSTNSGRLDPTIGGRTPRISNASSDYNGLQVEVRRGFSNTAIGGIQFTSNYTWSKSMDIVSEVFATNPNPATQGSSQRVILTYPKLDWGPSDFDVRHVWQSTVVWDIRGPKGRNLLGQTLGGWTLTWIIPVQSGSPFDVLNGFDRDLDGGTADRPDIGNIHAPITSRANAVAASTCSTGYQNIDTRACVTPADVHFISWGATTFGGGMGTRMDPNDILLTLRRNAVRTPDSWLVHMNVIKKFSLTERFNLEYRAEIFNILNHENFNYTPGSITVGASQTAVDSGKAGTFLDYSTGRPAGDRSTNSRTMRMALKLIF